MRAKMKKFFREGSVVVPFLVATVSVGILTQMPGLASAEPAYRTPEHIQKRLESLSAEEKAEFTRVCRVLQSPTWEKCRLELARPGFQRAIQGAATVEPQN